MVVQNDAWTPALAQTAAGAAEDVLRVELTDWLGNSLPRFSW